ncbi:hypothetical protein [Spongiimicrobium salis]|uniref:hypothetical protein n=1 Tax=Spongiimicrobium salis TaxID=1667022 RepID=UPI00374D4513
MEEKPIPTELKSHFLRLYQIAIADEDFDVLEMQMLYKFAEDRGVSKEQLKQLLLSPTKYTAIPEGVGKRVEYLYDLATMIWADGIVMEDEYNMIKKYCQKFGFEEENIIPIVDYLLKNAKENIPKETILKSLNVE